MLLYFEFEERRRKADVKWPKDDEAIVVHINDNEIAADLPVDLIFDVDAGKVIFNIEDMHNKRLLDLQKVLSRRLQEFVNQG
jgi:hypothetical protein